MPYQEFYQQHMSQNMTHQRHLSNPGDYWSGPMKTDDYSTMTALGALAAGGLGLYAAFRKGLLKKPMEMIMTGMSRFKPEVVDSMWNRALEWNKAETPWDMEKNLFFKYFDPEKGMLLGGGKEHLTELGSELYKAGKEAAGRAPSPLYHKETHLERMVREAYGAKGALERLAHESEAVRAEASSKIKQGFMDLSKTPEEMAEMERRSGHQWATVKDLYDKGLFKNQGMIDVAAREVGEEFWNLPVDTALFKNTKGELHDLRAWPDAIRKTVSALEDHFGIPFVHFNPLKVFHIGDMMDKRNMPVFQVLSKTDIQPLITNHVESMGHNVLYANGKIFSMAEDETLGKYLGRGSLWDARKGFVRTFVRSVSGAGAPVRTGQTEGSKKLMSKIFSEDLLDIGNQDLHADIDTELGSLGVLDWPIKKAASISRKFRTGPEPSPETAFGDTRWLFLRSMESGRVARQVAAGQRKMSELPVATAREFFASRKDLRKVTTATLPLYTFFSRLDASVAQLGLGLSSKHKKSGLDILGNLLLRRTAPVLGAMAAWKYLNYTSNAILGTDPDEIGASVYEETSVGLAHVRDALGLTNLAKEQESILSGFDQIKEMPLVGRLFDWSMNAEETRKYWEEGETPIRKGRWWPLGNTPFTGGRIDHWEPNRIRRAKNREWAFEKYGGEDEYWAHSLIPNPLHPFSTLTYLSDPYWMEKKHYQDRPYLQTGGVMELEELPLLGPLLGGTLGELIKPTRRMHEEVWQQIENGENQTHAEGTITPVGPETGIDPLLLTQWGLIAGGATGIDTSHAKRTVVAVLDTGADTNHPDLQGKLLPGYNAVDQNSNVEDKVGHGTHVSGIIAATANNKQGIAGVAPVGVDILPVKVLNDKGIGTDQDIIRGLNWAKNWRGPEGERVSVINMSLGGLMTNPAFGDTLKDVRDSGIFIAAAAGNDGIPVIGQPAVFPETMAVGAVGYDMQRADFSSYGRALDIMAPGVNIVSTVPEGSPIDRSGVSVGLGYSTASGTSMATPFVAASAAVLKSLHSDLNPDELTYLMEGTATDTGGTAGWDPETGYGVINLTRATMAANQISNRQLRAGAQQVARGIDAERQRLLNALGGQAGIVMTYSAHMQDKYGEKLQDPSTIAQRMTKVGSNIGELGGIYGFFAGSLGSLLSGDDVTRDESDIIADSRAMYSWRRDFWDENIGGLGGELNEIARRFVGRREKWEQRYNPISNTMPSWLPGSEYFVDFRHGDPYTKMAHGEMRLPGEAYEDLHPDTKAEVEAALTVPGVQEALDAGILTRGDLYGTVSRFRILADVAPWSQQFKDLRHAMSIGDIKVNAAEEKELKDVREQLKKRVKPMRLYPYHFRYGDTKKETVTVTKVLDTSDETREYFIYTKEYPLNPIKLAGLHVPTGIKDKTAISIRDYLNERIKPGEEIDIEYNAQEGAQFEDDTYNTINAVVYSGITNLNRELIDSGLVKEKETDYSPAALKARFSRLERMEGSIWEFFAHRDTPFHTKFLQVRSPLESYERRDLYGKDFQDWQHPIESFVEPTIESMAHKNVLIATGTGAILGSLLGHSKLGRLIGATAGAVLAGGASAIRTVDEAVTGKTWVPKRRREQWDTNEYFDILNYLKNMRLFETTADQAKEEEGFDVRKYLTDLTATRDQRLQSKSDLQKKKREIKAREDDYTEEQVATLAKELGVDLDPKEKDKKTAKPKKDPTPGQRLIKAINRKITEFSTPEQPPKNMGPLAKQALAYLDQAKSTMYGSEAGDPLKNVIRALPKTERQYLPYFVDAPAEEREKILAETPPYMRRILMQMWGQIPAPGDEKPDLNEYFRTHVLPGQDWEGWRSDVNLQDVKVKFIKHEGKDPSDYDLWPADEKMAAMDQTPVPRKSGHNSPSEIKRKLEAILTHQGFSDLMVSMQETKDPRIQVNMEVSRDRREELREYVNNNAEEIFY